MANKGNAKKQKRISYQGKGRILRKACVWTYSVAPGTHKKSQSAVLGVVLRDILKLADNSREAKYILENKTVLVNDVRKKNIRFPIGIFDVLNIVELGKKYRVLYDTKGYICLKELDKKDKALRFCKIVDKTQITKGKVQLNLDNGFNIIVDKDNYKTNDTLLLDNKKIVDTVKFDKGSLCYIVGGPHVSKSGKIKEILQGSVGKKEEVVIENKDGLFKTISAYVFVVKDL